MSGEIAVELVVKNPYTHSNALPFSCSVVVGTTVWEVKSLLNESYPGKPNPNDMRLVFFGKIHPDSASLGSIFKGQDLSKPQTCHLIISGSSRESSEERTPPANVAEQAPKTPAVSPTQVREDSSSLGAPFSQVPNASENSNVGAEGEENMALLQQWQRQQLLLQQQLSATSALASAAGLHGLDANLNVLAGCLGGVLHGANVDQSSLLQRPGVRQHVRESADTKDASISPPIEQQKSETIPGESSSSSVDTDLESELSKLNKAYEQLLRTLTISQQIFAISNPLLLTPQPLLWNAYHNQQASRDHPVYPENIAPTENDGNIPPPRVQVQERVTPIPNVNNLNREQNNLNGAAQNAIQNGGNVRVVRRVVVINIPLIFKLCFLLYLVANDASYTKLICCGLMALLYYAHEMGYLRSLVGTEFSVTGVLERLGQRRMLRIPPDSPLHDNFSTDAIVVMKTFILSLLPSWHCQPYAEEHEHED